MKSHKNRCVYKFAVPSPPPKFFVWKPDDGLEEAKHVVYL
jgi:hypothetical protein